MDLISNPISKDEDEPVHGSSDRTFGLVFTAFFLLVGLAPLLHGRALRPWSVALGLAFLAVALVRPALLAPLNRLWTRFGLLLHRIVNPIVMAVMFFVALTPFAMVLRLMGKDPLRRRREPAASTYWIARTPPGPTPKSMTNQF
jgi:hypothetical protein